MFRSDLSCLRSSYMSLDSTVCSRAGETAGYNMRRVCLWIPLLAVPPTTRTFPYSVFQKYPKRLIPTTRR